MRKKKKKKKKEKQYFLTDNVYFILQLKKSTLSGAM